MTNEEQWDRYYFLSEQFRDLQRESILNDGRSFRFLQQPVRPTGEEPEYD